MRLMDLHLHKRIDLVAVPVMYVKEADIAKLTGAGDTAPTSITVRKVGAALGPGAIFSRPRGTVKPCGDASATS